MKTVFSVLLETWEAGENYFLHLSVKKAKTTEVAKLLGWIRKDTGQTTNENSVRPNCNVKWQADAITYNRTRTFPSKEIINIQSRASV